MKNKTDTFYQPIHLPSQDRLTAKDVTIVAILAGGLMWALTDLTKPESVILTVYKTVSSALATPDVVR